MEQDITKAIMNPTRLRIIQFLILNETATTGQIKTVLTDIPAASLYRHIKTLELAGLINVVSENRIRGAVEKVYALNTESPISTEPDNAAIAQIINSSLLSIMGSFTHYLQKENSDPQKDLLFLTTSSLLLNDEEFMAFTQKLSDAVSGYIHNKPEEGRKIRRFTFISSPCEEA